MSVADVLDVTDCAVIVPPDAANGVPENDVPVPMIANELPTVLAITEDGKTEIVAVL